MVDRSLINESFKKVKRYFSIILKGSWKGGGLKIITK